MQRSEQSTVELLEVSISQKKKTIENLAILSKRLGGSVG